MVIPEDGTLHAVIQLNGAYRTGGVKGLRLDVREPYLDTTNDNRYYLYVGQGGLEDPVPVRAVYADTATSVRTTGEVPMVMKDGVISCGGHMEMDNNHVKIGQVDTGKVTSGNRPQVDLENVGLIQLTKGASYGTRANRDALTEVQIGQVFFVVEDPT